MFLFISKILQKRRKNKAVNENLQSFFFAPKTHHSSPLFPHSLASFSLSSHYYILSVSPNFSSETKTENISFLTAMNQSPTVIEQGISRQVNFFLLLGFSAFHVLSLLCFDSFIHKNLFCFFL